MRKEPTPTGGKLRAIRERVEDQPGLDQAPDRSPDQAEQESAEQALLTQRLQAQYGHEQVNDALTGQDPGPMGTLILAEWALGTAGDAAGARWPRVGMPGAAKAGVCLMSRGCQRAESVNWA